MFSLWETNSYSQYFIKITGKNLQFSPLLERLQTQVYNFIQKVTPSQMVSSELFENTYQAFSGRITSCVISVGT